MPIRTLPARQSLSKQVAEIISRKITSGEFSKNTYLPPERELGKAIGVSRTVIREAIKSLESCAMVQVERGKGVLVIDAQEQHLSQSIKRLLKNRGHVVQHLMEFRYILEVAVAGLAADRRTQANLTAMKRWLQIMRENPGEPTGYVDADVEFHNEIMRASQNPTLLLLLEPVSDLLRDSRIASFSGADDVRLRAVEKHEEILRLIEKRNAEGARLAMAKHLSNTAYDLAERLHIRASALRRHIFRHRSERFPRPASLPVVFNPTAEPAATQGQEGVGSTDCREHVGACGLCISHFLYIIPAGHRVSVFDSTWS